MVPLTLGNPHFMASLSFHGLAALASLSFHGLAALGSNSQMLVFKLGGFFCLEIG